MNDMIMLAVVPLIVWFGVFAYLFMLDRKLSRIESEEKDGDDL